MRKTLYNDMLLDMFFPTPCSMSLLWQLEINHDGRTYAMQIVKCYKIRGFFGFCFSKELRVTHLPAHCLYPFPKQTTHRQGKPGQVFFPLCPTSISLLLPTIQQGQHGLAFHPSFSLTRIPLILCSFPGTMSLITQSYWWKGCLFAYYKQYPRRVTGQPGSRDYQAEK